MPDVINVPMPANRRYSRPYPITPSNVVTDKNLQRNGVPFLYLQNLGAGGVCNIAWEPDATEVTVYLGEGQVLELGHPRHLKTTGTTAAGPFRGFLGVEGP